MSLIGRILERFACMDHTNYEKDQQAAHDKMNMIGDWNRKSTLTENEKFDNKETRKLTRRENQSQLISKHYP